MRRIVLAGAALTLFGATAATPSTPLAPPPPGVELPRHWRTVGCEHGHPSSVAYKRIRALVRTYRPMTKRRGVRARHYAGCLATAAKARAAGRKLRAHRRWRRSYGPRWRIRFNALPAIGQGWARSTSWCESRNRRVAREGGFLSYFQWVMRTWLAAGGFGNPEGASWHHQAVLAWRWHVGHLRGQWPNCGE